MFGKGKCKLIANFSAKMVTSLPSVSESLSLSLSHRAHLTHNIGNASAQGKPRKRKPRCLFCLQVYKERKNIQLQLCALNSRKQTSSRTFCSLILSRRGETRTWTVLTSHLKHVPPPLCARDFRGVHVNDLTCTVDKTGPRTGNRRSRKTILVAMESMHAAVHPWTVRSLQTHSGIAREVFRVVSSETRSRWVSAEPCSIRSTHSSKRDSAKFSPYPAGSNGEKNQEGPSSLEAHTRRPSFIFFINSGILSLFLSHIWWNRWKGARWPWACSQNLNIQRQAKLIVNELFFFWKRGENQNGACAHYVMVSKFQWKPFWLATQRDPQNDWTATQNRVNYDVFAHAPSEEEEKKRKRRKWQERWSNLRRYKNEIFLGFRFCLATRSYWALFLGRWSLTVFFIPCKNKLEHFGVVYAPAETYVGCATEKLARATKPALQRSEHCLGFNIFILQLSFSEGSRTSRNLCMTIA